MPYRAKLITGHICAFLGLCGIAIAIATELTDSEAFLGFSLNSTAGKMVLGLITGGMLVLWVWMTTTYFKTKPTESAVAWGWFLFLANMFGSPFYFYLVYIRKSEER